MSWAISPQNKWSYRGRRQNQIKDLIHPRQRPNSSPTHVPPKLPVHEKRTRKSKKHQVRRSSGIQKLRILTTEFSVSFAVTATFGVITNDHVVTKIYLISYLKYQEMKSSSYATCHQKILKNISRRKEPLFFSKNKPCQIGDTTWVVKRTRSVDFFIMIAI